MQSSKSMRQVQCTGKFSIRHNQIYYRKRVRPVASQAAGKKLKGYAEKSEYLFAVNKITHIDVFHRGEFYVEAFEEKKKSQAI